MSTHTFHAKTLISFITAFSVVMSGVVLFGYSSRVEATPREQIKDSWGTSRSDKASSEALEKGRKYSQDTVLVTFKKERINLQSESNDSRIRDVGRGYDIKSRINKSNSVVYKLSEGENVESAISTLQKNPLVEKVQRNYIYEPLAISTNDPDRQKLWGLDNTGQTVNGQAGTADADIDAPEAWGQLTGGESDVIVAVMDTGLDYNHPDLSGSLWDGSSCKDGNGNAMGGCIHGYDFGFDDKDPKPEANDWDLEGDYYNHGTHVTGTIAATHNNSEGILGVSKNAKIMGLKVSTDVYYYDHITTANMIRALHFAAANGAKVINISLGQYYYDTALEEAIIQSQLLVVAAAGNDGTNNDVSPVYPCSFDHASIICVAATDNQDKLAGYSNYGVTSVDIAAPGTHVYSTVDNFDYMNPTITDIYSQSFDGSTIPAEFTVSSGATWGIADNMLVTNTATPYENNKNQSLTYNNTFDTSDGDGVAVSFYAKCDTEYDTNAWTDYMRIDFSWDGGNSWLSNYNPEDYDYRSTLDFDEPQLDYENGDTVLNPNDNPGGYAEYQYTEKQNPYSGFSTDQLTFRFVWITDASDQGTAGGGCAIDNFVLHKVDFPVTRTYEYKSGTSMAAPHVTGAVALALGKNSSLSHSEVKDIIIYSGDMLLPLINKVNYGKRLNLHNTARNTDLTKWYGNSETKTYIELANHDGKVYESIRGLNNMILTRSSNDGLTWSDWERSDYTAGSLTLKEFNGDLFHTGRNSNGDIIMRKKPLGGNWTNWVVDGGKSAAKITYAVYDGKLFQAVRRPDNTISTRYTTDGNNWTEWLDNGKTPGNITMTEFNGKMYQAVRGNSGMIFTRYTTDGINWSQWKGHGYTPGNVTMNEFNGMLYQAVRGNSGGIFTRYTSDGENWTEWNMNGATPGDVSMVVFDSKLVQSVRGNTNRIFTRYTTDGENWTGWKSDGESQIDVSMIVYNDRIVQAVRGNTTPRVYSRVSYDAETWSAWKYE